MRSCVEQRCEQFVPEPAAKHSAALGVPFRRFPGLAPGAFINPYRLHRSTIERRSEVKSSSEQVAAAPALISATRPLWPDRPVRRRKKGTEDGHRDV